MKINQFSPLHYHLLNKRVPNHTLFSNIITDKPSVGHLQCYSDEWCDVVYIAVTVRQVQQAASQKRDYGKLMALRGTHKVQQTANNAQDKR